MLSNLNKPPVPLHLEYLQADYIELLCLVNVDRFISRTDVCNIFLQDGDLNDLNDFEEMHDSKAEKEDDNSQRIDDWFRHLNHRSHMFGNAYPFSLSQNGKSLERHNSLNDHQKLYIFLLLASQLRCLDKNIMSKFTNSFEVVSLQALKEYLPGNAQVHLFGTNPLNKDGDFSQSLKYERIKKLSEALLAPLQIKQDDFPKGDMGDEGLDIVAWLSIGDEAPGFITIFGQCACGNKWVEKQSSSGFYAWRQIIDLKVETINMIFIPHCFRDLQGKWYQPRNIHNTIMIDRVRMIRLLQKCDLKDIFTNDITDFLTKMIDYIEPSV